MGYVHTSNSSNLFSTIDWFSVDRNRREEVSKEIASIPGDRLLNTSPSDLCQYIETKYYVDVPTLEVDHIVADQREEQIDVSRDQHRLIHDRSRPFFVTGTRIEITIPFRGDPDLFQVQPPTYTFNPPKGMVRSQHLLLTISGADLSPESVRTEIDALITSIQNSLTNLRGNAAGFNSQLKSLANTAIATRRNKLLADRSLVASLGFTLKERPDAEQTYVVPSVRRSITPVLPPASNAPYAPEPTLGDTAYDHILRVLENMAHVMERSPSAFATMDEETLRTHFLVQLNGQYEGQATAETFNAHGKTDILIRVDGRNIFIGECKFWGGSKKLLETIDQILGYSSWRDTKVAILIFNRNRDFSRVLAAIPEAIHKHPLLQARHRARVANQLSLRVRPPRRSKSGTHTFGTRV
jgi:hypothetical protein